MVEIFQLNGRGYQVGKKIKIQFIWYLHIIKFIKYKDSKKRIQPNTSHQKAERTMLTTDKEDIRTKTII